MKQVFRIDIEGYFIESVILKTNQKKPSDCVEIFPTQGLFRPKWNGISWVEGLPQNEIDVLLNAPRPLSELEQLKQKQELMQKAIDDLILGRMF